MAFKISNSSGRGSDAAWREIFGTKDDAAEAVKNAMGWDDVAVSESFADDYADDEGERVITTSWCCYESQEECDADQEGAHAPRITEVEAE